MPTFRFARTTALLVVLGLAASCGGGGGSSGSTSSGGTGTPPSASMNAAELTLAMDALGAINAHRAGQPGGLAPYQWYANGANVAYAHCLAMEAGGFFDHTDPGTNTTPASRSNNAGITHDPQGAIDPGTGLPFVGENLTTRSGVAVITFTGQEAVNNWIGSPGHNTQLVAPNPVNGAQTMPAWTHCVVGVRITPTQIWYTAMFWRNPTP